MKSDYNHQEVEPKWQAKWESDQLFQQSEQGNNGKKIGSSERSDLSSQDKMYLLFAFAYPSGSGLHVGHVESKTALDILARYYRMSGKQVFFPVGWDAFGLPAENYAVKTGVHPAKTTVAAIDTFRRQIKRLGISYDWANEIATSHPGYYQWTQWLFLELYKAGLAYKKPGTVNWCPSCQTVLANEQVVDGACERCDTEVVQKEMDQWYFKITEYTEELISGLDEVDWPEPTKQQQLNWIGKSKGADITWQVEHGEQGKLDITIQTFTTRFDTIPGVIYLVVAPEYADLDKLVTSEHSQAVKAYQDRTAKMTQLERISGTEKTGEFTGSYAINPFNGDKVPIYVADYVIATYGTGAVMGMPGHDQRDFDFAKAFELPVIYTTKPENGEIPTDAPHLGDGTQINSGKYDGLSQAEAKAGIIAQLESESTAVQKTQYKLRDWLISRQRYWGAPIPIVYDPEGNPHPVKEEHLPWTLPDDVDYNPKGKSPLASSKEFFERTEKLYGKGWTPEVDTMDTFVCSSWYYFRYLSSRDESQFMDKARGEQWLPVDFYMIGPEHIVLHLLYSRFFTKFLRDQGYVSISEPFMKMRHQGMILGPDGKKMSKSKGNVINPDEIIEEFGADTLRMYEMFMGPIEADKPWNPRAVAGVNRFLSRIWRLSMQVVNAKSKETSPELARVLHQTIRKVSDDIPKLKFNTSIASMMELVNAWQQAGKDAAMTVVDVKKVAQLLAPFAPFMAEELWHQCHPGDEQSESIGSHRDSIAALQNDGEWSIHQSQWPTFDPELAKSEQVIVAVQINGKLRGQLEIDSDLVEDITESELMDLVKADDKLNDRLKDQQIKKTIWIPPKGPRPTGLLSIVI